MNEEMKKVYSSFINQIEFDSISLLELNAKQFDRDKSNPNAGVKVEYNTESFYMVDQSLTVPVEFSVKVFNHSEDAQVSSQTEEPLLFQISFKLNVSYKMSEDREWEEEIIERFIKTNLPINVWPYARELVSSTSTRMGFPPLFLPLYKG